MDRKSFCFDLEWKRFETTDAPKLDRLSKRASRPHRSLGNSQVERIPQRSSAADILLREIKNRAFFLALEMQTVGVNLSEMDFQFLNLARSAAATWAGRNSATLPPSRAISFTIRELR